VDAEKYAALFATESREHIDHCNRDLLAWERDPASLDPIQGLFRSVHTLKGMAAAMGFGRLTALAHGFEHLLAGLRDKRVAASPELVDLGFRAVDLLEQGVALAVAGDADTLESDRLTAELGLAAAADPAVTGGDPERAPDTAEARPASAAGLRVRVRLRPGTPMPGARAAIVLRHAEGLGAVNALSPPADRWMQDGFDGAIAFRLETAKAPEEVRAALAGVSDVDDVSVGGARAGAVRAQVRVDQGRLDTLVALGSELVVARNRLLARMEQLRDPELEASAERLSHLVGEMQEQVLRTRMAPVAEVFDRFPRAARDLARQLGKQVQLEVEGAEIELDRAILDELADPLLHLVRNAIDHGLESPEQREAVGKSGEGRLRLRARRERNAVLIEVTDDGRGVDSGAVLARARREGWVASEGELGPAGLLEVLARPGFSTASEVTDVSGRGVGIDAVSHWVRAMGGATGLASRPGQGTTVTLRLPLTVAIVPALLVGIARERYAVPLGFVAETTQLPLSDGGTGEARVPFRGDLLPVIELAAAAPAAGTWRPGVILDVAGRRGALAVDTLFGQEDIVVSPLHTPAGTPGWVNGATILADGLPALVVDPAALV